MSNYISNNMDTLLNEMVHDFTQVGSRSKSEVRRRIQEYAVKFAENAIPLIDENVLDYGNIDLNQLIIFQEGFNSACEQMRNNIKL